jgi:hypothetical protein
MSPYGALQSDLKQRHPGFRFQVAAEIIRPLFSALEFLHFHRIVHAAVTWDSVLLRLRNNHVEQLLLVNYSTAYAVPPGEQMPRAVMVCDGRQAMELIEDCCDIWVLRNAPAPTAIHEAEMRRRTEVAEKEHAMVQHTCAHFFNVKGGDRHSTEGIKLLKLLADKEMDWSRAKTNQLDNAGLLQIGPVTANRLQEVILEWKSSGQSLGSNRYHFTALTLGHKFLDDLVNQLYHKRWNLLPSDICGQLRYLEGDVNDPWKTFTVTQKFPFRLGTYRENADVPLEVTIDGHSLVQYLAVCCDVYPEWRDSIAFDFHRILAPNRGFITQKTIGVFRTALIQDGPLPSTIDKTLQQLETLTNIDLRDEASIAEEHAVYYHVPSDMFNATQLRRVAMSKQLKACLANQSLRCENFAEVRGEQELQGNYVPLPLLPSFVTELGLSVRDMPTSERSYPAVNSSDFSQVSPGRIVLSRRGLVAFASVTRTANQFSHRSTDPLVYELADPFLPTYFGDIKVLPESSDGKFHHPRPEHWAQFKTAEQTEEGTDVSKRRILMPKAITGTRVQELYRQPQALSFYDGPNSMQSGRAPRLDLQRAIRERALAIAEARAPPQRPLDDTRFFQPKRKMLEMTGTRENLGVTNAFLQRNPHLERSPPFRGFDVDQIFPLTDDSESVAKARRRERRQVMHVVGQLTCSESRFGFGYEQTEPCNMDVEQQDNSGPQLERPGSPFEGSSTIADSVVQQPDQPPPFQSETVKLSNPEAYWLASRGVSLSLGSGPSENGGPVFRPIDSPSATIVTSVGRTVTGTPATRQMDPVDMSVDTDADDASSLTLVDEERSIASYEE